jgi:hypothetical protein
VCLNKSTNCFQNIMKEDGENINSKIKGDHSALTDLVDLINYMYCKITTKTWKTSDKELMLLCGNKTIIITG